MPKLLLPPAGDVVSRPRTRVGVVMIQVDIWLRGTDLATTQTIETVARQPREWVDEDVRLVLEGMLQAMYRAKHGPAEPSPVTLRGLSWIVNPYEDGGVVV